MNARFEGLIAAPFTPFHSDGSLNLARIPDLARALHAANVAGAFVCGTTGESASLTAAERKSVAEAWIAAAAGSLKIFVHAGHTSAGEARELIAHAAAIGAAATAVTAPYYFRPAGPAELAAFLAEVASGAPNLPFYYYDIPSTTGVSLPTADVLRRLSKLIPNLAGVKYSNPDLLGLQECVQLEGGKYKVLFGVDEYLMAAVTLGATGAVGSTYNYAATVYHRMLAAADAGRFDEARTHQFGSARLVRALIDFGGLRAGKAIMKFLGLDCGPVRTPLRSLSADEEHRFFDRIAGLDIFSLPLVRPT
jgi:N-acetylneuraminate lyase